MPRPPAKLPTIGDRCRLRGRGGDGVVTAISDRLWTDVVWASAGQPLICHLHELERVDA